MGNYLYNRRKNPYSYRMKFLQTGDFHLGKTLYDYSLKHHQRHMLKQIERELKNDSYAALLITGDIYDRSIPPAEAVELFSSFLSYVKDACAGIHIFIIPGNHDSAKRLEYASGVLDRQGIHISCGTERVAVPWIIEKDGEKAAVYQIPFLAAGSIETKDSSGELDFSAGTGPAALRSQQDMIAEAVRRIKEKMDPSLPAVLTAHLYTASGAAAGSERVFLGTAELVEPSLFRPFAYTALGHLHKPQRISDRVHYAGSPLAYSFDEAGAGKCFLKVTLDTAAPAFPVTVEQVPVVPLHRVRRLSGAFSDFHAGDAGLDYADDFLDICCTDDQIIENPMALLRRRFPLLLSLRQQNALERAGLCPTPEGGIVSRIHAEKKEQAGMPDDFAAFLADIYGSAVTEPDGILREEAGKERALFEKLLREETEHETA